MYRIEAVDELYAARNVSIRANITFIAVGKRHHIRFLPRDSRTADKSGNCPAGFVVDDNLTCPGVFDFYLQSQAGLLGSKPAKRGFFNTSITHKLPLASRPSHYIVIKDENDFDSDQYVVS